MQNLDYSMKLTLHRNGKFFGPGTVILLEFVDQTHSLNKASKKMSLAYTKALKMIKTAEQTLGFALLTRKVGGTSGGGSELTPKARKLLEYYKTFEAAVKEEADRSFVTLEQHIDKLTSTP